MVGWQGGATSRYRVDAHCPNTVYRRQAPSSKLHQRHRIAVHNSHSHSCYLEQKGKMKKTLLIVFIHGFKVRNFMLILTVYDP